MNDVADFWTDETSVLFTSFWGWTPEEWGMVPWTIESEREKIAEELTDPFICVVYVTNNSGQPKEERGKICGFHLVTHERGHRNEFSHPARHSYDPKKWQYALRSSRAFTYLPENRLVAKDVFPEVSTEGQTIGRRGKVITDSRKIKKLQECPWDEVEVFSSPENRLSPEKSELSATGMVPSGPARKGGYEVSGNIHDRPHELYVLKLAGGKTAAYLGEPAKNASIYKIGLSYSPEKRCSDFQKAMPKGAFRWKIDRTTRQDGHNPYINQTVAVVGEYAMKLHLAQKAEHLGGEFYLATKKQIDKAWAAGRKAAKKAAKNYKAKD